MNLQRLAAVGLALLLLCAKYTAGEAAGSAEIEAAEEAVLADENQPPPASHYW